jgi:hypothetical protein
MKLPGEAWLEFKIIGIHFINPATFRPKEFGVETYWGTPRITFSQLFLGMLNEVNQMMILLEATSSYPLYLSFKRKKQRSIYYLG